MFGGQICVLMGLVVLLLFVPVLRYMISTISNLFNNLMLLIMFKIFYVHFYRPMERTRVDKRVFWPQYFRKIEYVCLIGF